MLTVEMSKPEVQRLEMEQVTRKGYGENCEQPDMEPITLLKGKELLMEQLKCNQKNRVFIQKVTTGQHLNMLWHQFRQNLLNCSYFGRIVNFKNRNSYKDLLDEVMYKNSEFANSAENRHAIVQKREALNVFKTLFDKMPLKDGGLFIDVELCYLGASPFMVYGEDHILNISCPLNEFHQNINEAIKNKKISFWELKSGTAAINQRSNLYIEVQGEMHVAQRKFAYVMVWLGDNPSQYKIVEITKDDQFFENEMKEKLIFFYNDVMLRDKKKITKRKNSKPSGGDAFSQRPRRAAKRNRLFLDSAIWDNAANSSLSSLSPPIKSPPTTSTPTLSAPHITFPSPGTNGTDQGNVSMEPNNPPRFIPPLPAAPKRFIPPLPSVPKITEKTAGNGKKKKMFIRFRFQIDCSAAVDINVDDLVCYLKNNMKIDGKKNNLTQVTIERRNYNVHVMSKVMLMKKYLKELSKKYLKSKKHCNYHVLSKNKRAYKIVLK